MSRHPLTTHPDNKQQNLSDEHVRFVVNHAVPVALDVNTIRRATQDDPTCQKLIELLQNNCWNSLNTNNLHPEINTAELRAYELLKQELSLTPEADLIIRGNRLVIPTKPWHTANDCIRQWSTVPGRRNSPIYVYKWDQTPHNYAHMATSKRRSRDVHETANEVSTDGSRRAQGLETRATTIPAELPRHAPLYDERSARHSTVRTKHTHQATREVFESKHGRDRQEDQRS